MYTVGEFMTKKEDLHVVKPTTTVDEGSSLLSFKVHQILWSIRYCLVFILMASFVPSLQLWNSLWRIESLDFL